jgi:hypothetical protein
MRWNQNDQAAHHMFDKKTRMPNFREIFNSLIKLFLKSWIVYFLLFFFLKKIAFFDKKRTDIY